MLGLRDRVPLRRARVRRRRGRLQALPRGRRRRPGQLHARAEGLHPVHPGLPPLPHLGARHRDLPLRPSPHRRRGLGHRAAHRAGPGQRPRRAGHRAGRRARLRPPHLGPRERRDRRRPGVGPRGRRVDLEGRAAGRAHTRGRPRHGGLPLHLLGQPDGLPRGHRRRGRAHRPGGHGLPGLGAARDAGTQGRQDRAALQPLHRTAVLEDLRRRDLPGAASRRSTGWPGRTSSR